MKIDRPFFPGPFGRTPTWFEDLEASIGSG